MWLYKMYTMIVLDYKEEEKMNSYKEMYYYLFNQITDINEMLKQVQQTAEEMYLLQSEDQNINGEFKEIENNI